KLNTHILTHKTEMTTKEINYNTKFINKPSAIYGIPKIHKNHSITQTVRYTNNIYVNMPFPNDLTLRPIIAGPSCETHRLSNFVDILLKHFLKHIPSYIRDDLDMLEHLPKHINNTATFVSFDVINLYGSIPHQLVIESLNFWIEKHPETLPNRFSKHFIISSVKFILDNNYFIFDNTFYKQNSGIAMGTKAAPTIANLVMGHIEQKIYTHSKNTLGTAFHDYLLHNWKRYLDDC
ncbi:uncharacterized protein LOC115215981, partial [Argonauta hians]